MKGYKVNIEKIVAANKFFRQVMYTAKNTQLVVMNLKADEEIGMEVHDVDQFFRFEEGKGKAVVDGNEYDITSGDVLIVPAGARHNIINTSKEDELKLYTLYCPPHHKDGVIHEDKKTAEADKEHF